MDTNAGESLVAENDTWHRFESPNFELFSNHSEARARAILEDLELLRAVFNERAQFIERARRDVTVFCFATDRDFKAYAPDIGKGQYSLQGFYYAHPDRAVIVLSSKDDRESTRQVILHEYVHHLFTAAEKDPPVWYAEGMAELLSTMQVRRGELEMGYPAAGRLRDLQWSKLLALETLLAVTHGSTLYVSDKHTGVFYAQSWALLHFWFYGSSDLPAGSADRFLEIIESDRATDPVALREHFRECFGMDYAGMNARLREYVRKGKFTSRMFPLPEVPSSDSFNATVVDRDEMRLRLAELAFRIRRSETARLSLAHATVWSPHDTRPAEVLGAVAAMDGDTKTAVDYWREAVDSGSRNPALMRELARLECAPLLDDFDHEQTLPEDKADRLRAMLRGMIERYPEQSAGYELLAWVEAFSPDRLNANINLVQQAFPRLQHKARTLVALAVVRSRMGDKDKAIQLLNSVERFDSDPPARQAAEVLLASLEDRPVQRIAPDSGAVVQNSESIPVVESQLRIPSVPLPDDL